MQQDKVTTDTVTQEWMEACKAEPIRNRRAYEPHYTNDYGRFIPLTELNNKTMIQPQELRCNNIVTRGNGSILKVSAINPPEIVCIVINGTDNYKPYDTILPIHLTEEWLMKAGFVKPRYQKYYILNGVRIRWDNNLEYWEVHQVYLKQDMKYLHQLQNLYFALTGEELKIEI